MMNNTSMLELAFDAQSASIEGCTMQRPSHVSPSQWLDFWEAWERYTGGYARGREDGWHAAFADALIEEEDTDFSRSQ